MPSPVLDALAKSLALLLIAAGTLLFLRRSSASLRALILTTALAGLLVVPALTQLLPAWRVSILPAPAAPSQVPQETAPAPAPGVLRNSPVISSRLAGIERITISPDAPIANAMPFPWLAVALIAWSVGCAALLLRLALSHRTLARIAAAPGVAGPAWLDLVDQVRGELGVGRAVAVRTTPAVSVPAVAGMFRPVLLLPPDADEWAGPVRRDVVRHELAHVVRWDGVSQLIGQLACALQWFNPVVWLTARHAAALRERACDDVVLRSGTRASDYAANLLNLAHHAAGAELQPAALAMARPNRIRERVMNVLNPAARRERVSGRATVAVMLLAGSAMTAVAAVEPAARAAQTMESRVNVPAGGTATSSNVTREEDRRTGASTMVAWGVEPVVKQDTSGFCRGEMDNSTTSISDDVSGRKWTVKLRGRNCSVDLRSEGKIEFNPDFTDIASISRGGFFRLDVTTDGVRRQLEIEPGGSGLDRVYKVDGTEHAYDAEARAWFAGFLIELDRRTAIAVDIRLPRLLRQGGVPAVLSETALMPSDYARNQYYTKMMETTRLSVEDRGKVLEQGARLMESDYYGSELIKAVIAQGRLEDPAERQAVVGMIKRMESDYYRSETMKTLLTGRINTEQMSALLEVTAGMESDYYKSEMLKDLLNEGDLTSAQRSTVLEAASSIQSDYYIGEVLKLLTERGLLGPAERTSFLRVVSHMESDNGIAEVLGTLMVHHALSADEIKIVMEVLPGVESDYYKGEILDDLLQAPALTEGDLLNIVAQVGRMDSDYYASEALRKVLQHRSATNQVRKAVREAAEGLEGYYGQQVKRAAGAGEI